MPTSNHPKILTALCAMLFLAGCGKGPPATEFAITEVQAGETKNAEISTPALANTDWPQWRGPNGDGTSSAKEVPKEWGPSKNIAWSVDIPGRGHSSPIVIGSQIFLATALVDKQQQLVLAFDRASGKSLWTSNIHEGGLPKASEVHIKGSHANGTLASDGKRLFVAFLNGGKIVATALDMEGKRLWQTDAGPFSSKFGYAPSPVIYKSTVIISGDNWGGGFIAALHRETGEIVWRKKRPAISTYSSPLLAKVGGRDQLVITGCNQFVSLDPATGDEIWSCRAIAEATCGTPVTDGYSFFASGGYPDRQTVCVAGDGSAKILWSNKTKVYEPSLIVAAGNVFSVSDDGIACCWNAKTGEMLWKQRIGGSYSASPILCNGLIFVPNLAGETIVFEANGNAYREVARNKLGNDSYSSIAVSDKELFLRVGFGEGEARQERLICIRQQAETK